MNNTYCKEQSLRMQDRSLIYRAWVGWFLLLSIALAFTSSPVRANNVNLYTTTTTMYPQTSNNAYQAYGYPITQSTYTPAIQGPAQYDNYVYPQNAYAQNAYAQNAYAQNVQNPQYFEEDMSAGRSISGPISNQNASSVSLLYNVGKAYDTLGNAIGLSSSKDQTQHNMKKDQVDPAMEAHRSRVALSAQGSKNNPRNIAQSIGNTVKAGLNAGTKLVDAGIQVLSSGKSITNAGARITDNVIDMVNVGTSTASQLLRDAANLSPSAMIHTIKNAGKLSIEDVRYIVKETLLGSKNTMKNLYAAGGSSISAARFIAEDETLRTLAKKVGEGVVEAVLNDLTLGGYSLVSNSLQGVAEASQAKEMLSDAASLGNEVASTLTQRLQTGGSAPSTGYSNDTSAVQTIPTNTYNTTNTTGYNQQQWSTSIPQSQGSVPAQNNPQYNTQSQMVSQNNVGSSNYNMIPQNSISYYPAQSMGVAAY